MNGGNDDGKTRLSTSGNGPSNVIRVLTGGVRKR